MMETVLLCAVLKKRHCVFCNVSAAIAAVGDFIVAVSRNAQHLPIHAQIDLVESAKLPNETEDLSR